VKTEIWNIQKAEHLECDVGLHGSSLHGLAMEPFPLEGRAAKRVATRPTEGMPITDGKPQLLFHRFA
jgi:hypothetical protein